MIWIGRPGQSSPNRPTTRRFESHGISPPFPWPRCREISLRSPVEGRNGAQGSSFYDVRIDHRGFYVLVPQQLLDGADVCAGFQQVGGEGMPEGVAGDALVDLDGVAGRSRT